MPSSFICLLIASTLMAFANFLIRKTIELSYSKKDSILPIRLGSTALLSSLFVVGHLGGSINTTALYIGFFTGILQGGAMHFSVRCMAIGPSSFVVAIQNASCIFPAILMAFFFGENFGHAYSYWNLIGAAFIAIGLFFAFSPAFYTSNYTAFFSNLICLVVCQVLFLTFFQWFALLQRADTPNHPLLFCTLSVEEANIFLPACFLTAFFINLIINKGRILDSSFSKRHSLLLGVGGGAAAALGGKFLEISTRLSTTSFENNLLFPTLAVSQVAFCSLWGKYFFSEKIIWPALSLALFGLFIALYV